MEEAEFRELIHQYAIQTRLEQGEVNLTTVLKLVIAENPQLKTQVRSSIAIVKEEIAKVDQMDEDELGDLSVDIESEESSEYEMLENLVVQKFSEDKKLEGQIKALIIYGSYAKRLHIVGESDINFVVVLNPEFAQTEIEEAINKIGEIAEEIVTPEVAHIFDLMILKEDDLSQLEKFGADFSYIHALYAKEGEVKLGTNVFTSMDISKEQIREAAKVMISEAILQFDDIINTAKNEGLPDEELDYLVGASIIDIAFALCIYQVDLKAITMDLVKPDIHEEFREIFEEKTVFSNYYDVLEQAHAFKLGIKLPNSQNFMQESIEFIKKVIEYTGLNKNKT
ncbi:MAG: nucleotidyltransferase domain-containing protein [Promethearchaeota archaeon]